MAKRKEKLERLPAGVPGGHFVALSLKRRRMTVYVCESVADGWLRVVATDDASYVRLVPVAAIGGTVRPAERRGDKWYIPSHPAGTFVELGACG